jgi:hypothetical protein
MPAHFQGLTQNFQPMRKHHPSSSTLESSGEILELGFGVVRVRGLGGVVYLFPATLKGAPGWHGSGRWWRFVPAGRRGGVGAAGRGWLVDNRLACGSGGGEHRNGLAWERRGRAPAGGGGSWSSTRWVSVGVVAGGGGGGGVPPVVEVRRRRGRVLAGGGVGGDRAAVGCGSGRGERIGN